MKGENYKLVLKLQLIDFLEERKDYLENGVDWYCEQEEIDQTFKDIDFWLKKIKAVKVE